MMIVGIVGGLAVLPDRWDRTGFVWLEPGVLAGFETGCWG